MEGFRATLSRLSEQLLFLSLQEARERLKQDRKQPEVLALCKSLKEKLGDRVSGLQQAGITLQSFTQEKEALVGSMKVYHEELLDKDDWDGAEECDSILSSVEALSLTRPSSVSGPSSSVILLLKGAPEDGKSNGSNTFLMQGTYSSLVRSDIIP